MYSDKKLLAFANPFRGVTAVNTNFTKCASLSLFRQAMTSNPRPNAALSDPHLFLKWKAGTSS